MWYCQIWQERRNSLQWLLCNSPNFHPIKNRSSHFVPLIKWCILARGISKTPILCHVIPAVQKWWCLSDLHHTPLKFGPTSLSYALTNRLECYDMDQFPTEGWLDKPSDIRRRPLYGLGWCISGEDVQAILRPQGPWRFPIELINVAFLKRWVELGYHGK